MNGLDRPRALAGPLARAGPRPAWRAAAVAAALAVTLAAPACRGGGSPTPGAAPVEAGPAEDSPIVAVTPARLSPEAIVLTERYRCVCGCDLALSECTCSNTPGSHDMKATVQSLVDEKRSAAEIDRAMVEKYGGGVLLAAPGK